MRNKRRPGIVAAQKLAVKKIVPAASDWKKYGYRIHNHVIAKLLKGIMKNKTYHPINNIPSVLSITLRKITSRPTL